jgi:RNA polymerase sigma-70 factor (ECF subfamily)
MSYSSFVWKHVQQEFKLDKCSENMFISKDNIDRFAYTKLVRNFSGRIFGICLGMLGNREDAEDITQQTFLKGFSDIKQLRDTDKFGGWISQIARHMCLDFLRRKKLNKSVLEKIAVDDIDKIKDCDLDRFAKLKEAIQKLTEEERVPLMLFYFDGQSTKNIALTLGLTIDTAQKRLSRARQKLRELLSTEGGAL